MMYEVENRTVMIALAPRDAAATLIRSIACSRASAMSLVYSVTSPPMMFVSTARMSRPMWRARTVLP
jgi:hypothetical protein